MKGRAEKKRRKIRLLQSEKFKRFLSMEIGIEIKACLYFSIILFYYFLHRVVQGSYAAGIPVMIEMVLTSYAMSYLQVYLLQNFDEAERFGAGVAGRSVFCTALYTVIAYLFRWFDGNLTVTFCFFPYMLITYLCVFLIYKLKRDIDTAQLNRELERFKSRRDKEEDGAYGESAKNEEERVDGEGGGSEGERVHGEGGGNIENKGREKGGTVK